MLPALRTVLVLVFLSPIASCASSKSAEKEVPPIISLVETTPSAFSLNPEVKEASIESGEAHATVCFDIPSQQDWVLGRLPGDVFLTVAGTEYPMLYFINRSITSPTESVVGRRCDVLVFEFDGSTMPVDGIITARRLAASLPEHPDWEALQNTLNIVAPSLAIEALPGVDGLSFGLLHVPGGMTDREAHDIVVGLAEPVAIGPWQISVQFPAP
jgi:hypothetical protein